MVDVGFGGASNVGWTDQFGATDGIGLPTGRAMASGSVACLITAGYAYVGGRFRSGNASITFGSASSSSFGISDAGSSYGGYGYVGLSNWLVAGGSATWRINLDGMSNLPRGGGGSSYDSYGGGWSGTLAGAYRYVQAPTAPASLTLTANADPTKLNVAWTAPSTDGETAITGYRVEYSTSPTFTTITVVNVGVVLSTILTGLLPGTRYYVRVAAKNAVTTAASSWSVYSTAKNEATLAGGKIRVSGVMVPRLRKIKVAGSWVTMTRRIRVGGSWTPVL